jgi:ribosomal-protein-serine acetyltransferase
VSDGAFDLGGGRELRVLDESDAEELYALIDANRAHLEPWMQWAPDQTLERTRAFIREVRERNAAGDGFQGAVCDEGRIVGVAGMHRIDWTNRSVELGYWLAADAQGSGIMTVAAAALARHAFDVLGLHRVQICAAVDNARSRALIERLGFTCEGVARQHYRMGDAWHDDAVYSMLAGERDALPPPLQARASAAKRNRASGPAAPTQPRDPTGPRPPGRAGRLAGLLRAGRTGTTRR